MSLGWQTESTLIPREPKPILGVSTTSLLRLQAVVYDREERGSLPSVKRRRAVAEAKARNAGVEARNAKDELKSSEADPSAELIAARLQEKAKRYDAMVAGRESPCGEGLVDFARKRGWSTAEEVDETEQDGIGAAVPPPACLSLGGSNAATPSSASHPSSIAATVPSAAPSSTGGVPVETAPQVVTPMRQAFERPNLSQDDLAYQNRLRARTEHCRETVGKERREARESVRDRLAALRAAKGPMIVE